MTAQPPSGSAPVTASPSTPSPARRSRGPWLVALVALVFGLVSTLLAAVALVRTGQVKDQIAGALAAPAQPPASATPLPEGVPPVSPAPSPTLDFELSLPPSPPEPYEATDPLNPTADFEVAYTREELTAQASSNAFEIDLDLPQVRPNTGADIEVRRHSSSTPYFTFRRGVLAAEVNSQNTEPRDCATRLRVAALELDAEVPAQTGKVLCIATSPEAAASQGITPKIVLLHVTRLRDDGRVTMNVTAWQVPR